MTSPSNQSLPSAVQLTAAEVIVLTERMRDLQLSVADYHASSAGDGDLGRRVRSFLVAAHALHDNLLRMIADRASYASVFDSNNPHPRASLIRAVSFARNVQQHVMHIVEPMLSHLVGGDLGFREYAQWEEIPTHAVARTRTSTQKLEPYYRAELQGHEVTETMLGVLRFYADVVPQIVHRNQRGEWTGFPLLSQPGVRDRLHPEEPTTAVESLRWMNTRRPGGDRRVVFGQVTVDEVPYVYGFTFGGRLSFAPFVESADQVRFDVGLGYPYFQGSPSVNLADVTGRFLHAKQGRVWESLGEITTWANPLTSLVGREDWAEPGAVADEWRRIVERETHPKFSQFDVRRARRLYAIELPE